MKGSVLALIACALVLSGCGKVAEARNALKTMSTTVDAAKDMAKSAAGGATNKQIDLTEASVRRYYGAVVKLRQKYPAIEFENAIVATMQAGSQGKDLKKIVPADGGLGFDEYSSTSGAILAVMATGAAAATSYAMVPQLESSIKQMEATDTSKMTVEQKTALQQQIATQKLALEQARAQATPEAAARKAQFEMVARVRKEMGL
jgi:hypothetical protein